MWPDILRQRPRALESLVARGCSSNCVRPNHTEGVNHGLAMQLARPMQQQQQNRSVSATGDLEELRSTYSYPPRNNLENISRVLGTKYFKIGWGRG